MGERKAEPLSAEEITELRGWDTHTTITRLLATLDEARAALAASEERLGWQARDAIRLHAALAASEASQRALRSALEWWCVGPGLYDGWRCSRCNARADTRDALLHAPDCLLAVLPPTAAQGTED